MSPQSRTVTPKPDEAALLRRARRLELIGRIADDLAHEIKNPLNALVINLEVLRRRADSGDTAGVLDRVAVLDHEVGRLDRLVGELLRLVRPAREDASGTADVNALLDGLAPLIERLADIARVDLDVRAGEGFAEVAAPPDALRFALLHLVDAALRTLPNGGRVAIAIDESAAAIDLRITIRPAGNTDAFDAIVHGQSAEAVAAARDLLAAAGGEVGLTATGDAAGPSFLIRLHRVGSA